jgi:fatty-acyl-CoA synthase
MSFEEFHNHTLGKLLSVQAEKYPDQSFLKFDNKVWTYSEVENQANRLAAGMRGLGIQQGDRLAIILPNIPAFVVAVFAAAKAGILFVPANVRRSEEEVIARLTKTQPKALITFSDPDSYEGQDHLEMALALKEKVPSLEHVILYGGKHKAAISWDELVRHPDPLPKVDIKVKDPVTIIHTLGSMGEPRGALLTHLGLVKNAATMVSHLEATPEDIFMGAIPFSNTFGLTATILTSAIAGAQLVCLQHYTPTNALDIIKKEKITVHPGVPAMFAMELNHPKFDSKKCASLRTGIMAGAPCPPELVKRVPKEMDCDVLIAYGLTEASPGVTMTHLTDGPVTRTETVGRPFEGVELKVVDENNQTLPFDEEGELWVRGYNVMERYWEDPEATAQVLDKKGWLHTGDLATISANGPVRIVGRKEDYINRAGYKVYPGTIEMKLLAYPGTEEVAVVGVPDLIFGELIYACVVRQPGADFTADELMSYAEEYLPELAVPDRIVFLEILPQRGTSGVDKAYLREHVRIRGHAWKFGKNVDTDAIIPARRCNTADPRELALYCMEDANPEFVNKMRRGDLIIADANFGCGSSREVAPLSIKAAGISAVIAKSFARIFFRNAINIGLPILECPDAVDGIKEGDEIEVEPTTGIIRNLTRNESYKAAPFPDFLQHIIDKGGLLAYVEDRLAAEASGN